MAEVTMEDASKVYDEDVITVRDMSLDVEDWESYRRLRKSSATAAANAPAPSRSGSLDVVLFCVFLVVFALLLTVVIPSFATVYTVDYGAQVVAAVVVTIPLAVLVLIFQRGVASGPTTGAVER